MGKYSSKLRNASNKRKPIVEGKSKSSRDAGNFTLTFNFQYLRSDNGHKLRDWETSSLLSGMLETFKHYSGKKMKNIFCKNFKAYGCWPPPDKTKFKPPKDVSDYENKNWASMHLQGRECVIGYMFENIFYVFWLDGDHHFWLSKKKYT